MKPGTVTDNTPVSIANSRQVDFTSKVNGRRYSISVGLPLQAAPEGGYSVLYVLDGYAYFASATEAVRVNGNAPTTIVVGVGYPGDASFIDETIARRPPLPGFLATMPPVWAAITLGRLCDLSLPASEEFLAASRMLGLTTDHVGGLDDFLATIETEVKPRVAAMAPIDRSNQAIFGHSLGGLAVLHALFAGPDRFRTFIAASPSISWGDLAVLEGEAKFAAAVKAGSARPRVLLTTGADEDVAAIRALERDPQMHEFLRRRPSRMVEDARELTVRLQALPGQSPYEVEDLAVFARQGHGISPWPALGRAISFAFPPPA